METRERRSWWWWRLAVDDFDQHLEYLKINYVLIIVRRLCVYSSIHLYTLHNSPSSWPKEKFYVRRATNGAEMDLKKYYSCVPPCGPKRRSFWNDAIINSLSWAFVHITVVMFSVWIGRTFIVVAVIQPLQHSSMAKRSPILLEQFNHHFYIFIFHSYIYILLGIVAFAVRFTSLCKLSHRAPIHRHHKR